MVFRAVENRITITRAANSGISSFVAPDGEIYDYLSEYGRYKEVEGILCNKIRFEDSATSWYTNHGDVFAFSCILVTAVLCLVALTIGGLVFIYDTLKSEKEPIKLEQHEIYLLPEVTIDG